ncbi:MAG TPA: 6-pyruvoyl tetrahydrobiopterin synthase [Flavobacteriaceae bacterium]|jgi:6-pyruvoyltetrahydropterin/6-carboxytetrahydropterin synthase|nr:6-pyruvoyl tetrahydrobiopterin synthase [Flavobacteriaceae bacterium]
MEQAAIFRKEHFNAAHRLHNPAWDAQKNQEVFGLCNNPNFHGHNYELIVCVKGPIDPETGYVIDTKALSDLIKKEVTDKLDHKNLNLDVPEFGQLNPTAENIARVIYQWLKPHMKTEQSWSLTLYETPRNYVQYPV